MVVGVHNVGMNTLHLFAGAGDGFIPDFFVDNRSETVLEDREAV